MFKRTLVTFIALCSLSAVVPAALAAGEPHVLLTTSVGNIELELNSQKAPVSTQNFVDYVNNGYYNNTIFHRVIPGFMIQGGGFTADFKQRRLKRRSKMKQITACVTCVAPFLWPVPQIKTAPPANSSSTWQIMLSSIMANVTLAMPCSVKWLRGWMW